MKRGDWGRGLSFGDSDSQGLEDAAAVSEFDYLHPRSVQVFSNESITECQNYVNGLEDDQKRRFSLHVNHMSRDNGYRLLPDLVDGLDNLSKLGTVFENMTAATDRLAADLAIAGASEPDEFLVSPILLVGPPGVGKTLYASKIARALGTSFIKCSAGSAQASFQLTGSSSQWGNSQPGLIFRSLAENEFAAPVLVIDEVDKISDDNRFSIMPTLLDLLEPVSAASYRDECLQATMDCSKTITLLTANSTDQVPGPLLSRVEVIHIEAPEPAQRLRIIEAEVKNLRRKTNSLITLSDASARELSNRLDIDLRRVTRLIRDAFAEALLSSGKNEVAVLKIPKSAKRTMGFM